MKTLRRVFAPISVSVSDLKHNPSAVIESAGGEAVAVLVNNAPRFYAVPAEMFEDMVSALLAGPGKACFPASFVPTREEIAAASGAFVAESKKPKNERDLGFAECL